MGSLASSLQRVVHSEKVRFGLVGVVNTAVDFLVLLVLTIVVGFPSVFANIISTSSAMTVSYLLNKRAVFGNTDQHNHRQVILFIIVTLSGLWLIQSIVIVAVSNLLQGLLHDVSAAVILVAAKVVATIVSLTWNYIWYSRVVFRKRKA